MRVLVAVIAAILLGLLLSNSAMASEVGAGAQADVQNQKPIRIASKNFNESYLLSEMLAQLLEHDGFVVERRFGLGGTLICYEALRNNEIDAYVEYTGTLIQAILKLPGATSPAQMNEALREQNLALLAPFGFDNTYALVIKQDSAQRLGLRNIGDLAGYPELEVVVSHEFLQREDGWPGLATSYRLPHAVSGIEHGLAYQALNTGSIDVTDAYSTDGELQRYQLQVLTDNKGYFPTYLAAPLVRADISPAAQRSLAKLAGRLDDTSMQRLNAEVVFNKRSFADVASEFLVGELLVASVASKPPGWRDLLPAGLLTNVAQHLKLTGIALSLAIVMGLGVSLLVFRSPMASNLVLYVCSLVQTIPSIALLALMIPLFGIGEVPAIIALFLYSLLPIVRNTVTALTTVDPTLVRVGVAIGLTPSQQLKHLYVPLSLPGVFAGVRTAAVISIGTATLAAFIGAGGLGDPIVTGLSLNDSNLILQGAIPAALLAIGTEVVFAWFERRWIPAHLQAR